MRIIKNLHLKPGSLWLKPYPLLLAAGLVVCMAGSAAAADISTFSSAGCAFPDTAQSISYTATFGEDHDYASSASTMSFTIHNGAAWGGTETSSVTVDNRTGLMWVTNTDDYNGGNYVSSGTYAWESALAKCESLTYAGFADWRLPNIKELVSIVDYSRQSPSINKAYFLNTQSNYYWSSTTYMPSGSYARLVYFGDGYVDSSNKANYRYARCVRGGP